MGRTAEILIFIFLVTVAAIFVHESVHVVQNYLRGMEIDQFVVLGLMRSPVDNGSFFVGWVTTKGHIEELYPGQLETEANLVTLLFLFIVIVFMRRSGHEKTQQVF